MRPTVSLLLALCLAAPAGAEMPYPPNPAPCGDASLEGPCLEATDFGRYLFLPEAEPPVRPNDWPGPGGDWKLTSDRTGEPAIDESPQELSGVKGASVDRAWQVTTGRPDVVIAVLDSGIRWAEPLPDLVNKFYLNRGELPVPEGSTNERDPHDRNGDGFFTVADYLASPGFDQDPRVSDQNDNGVIDPEDLIFLFSDGVDDDGNGYVDDISGWDFFEDDNDALDEVRYGHGTGQSIDSGAEANNGIGGVGTCPNCLILPVRVADSFVAEVNQFAQGVVFAVDSGAHVVQEALGALNQTPFGQQAVDYAWRNGVLVVASAADEQSNHHNYPANYNHTLEVNSVTRYFSQSGIEQSPRSYLYLNGCTNYGGHIHLSVPSSSCSSEATGLGAGMAALVVSAARNAVDAGTLAPYPRDDDSPAPHALSAEEVRQILIGTADDVDFDARPDADPPVPRNYVTRLPVPGAQQHERFASIAGWDQAFGYGRVNADRAVRRVAAGDIPPEAAFESPAWFDIVDPGPADARGGSMALTGRVAANRAASFRYWIDVAPGVQPVEADFQIEGEESGRSAALVGELGRVDLAALAARMPHGVEGPALTSEGRPDPDRFSFTVRVRVVDDQGRVAEDRRTLALHHDPDLFAGFTHAGRPLRIASDGVSAPATADLTGDGREEILFGSSEGKVYALRVRRTEAGDELVPVDGWPVSTLPLELHTDSRAFAGGAVDAAVATAIIGPIAVGDLDHDGRLEVVAADMQGRVYVWNHDGTIRPGFPVETLPEYSNSRRSERDPSTPEGRVPDLVNRHDRDNQVARGIVGGVSLGNLDGSEDGSLEIVAAALDRHVYAWRHDGTPVPGWPVLVKDPAKVASVDPATDEVTLLPGSGAADGTKLVAAPSLGDLDGDGRLEVVTVANEAYREPTNAVYTNLFVNLFINAGILQPGNTRVYAIHADGVRHGGSDQSRGWNPAAFVDGWPVKTSLLQPELLPFVGEGSNGPPALADVDRDGRLEVATFSVVGPAYLFRHDGAPALGTFGGGQARTFDTDALGAVSTSTDTPTFAALGAPVLAELAGRGEGFHLLAPAAGFGRFLDLQLPARQIPSDNQLVAWHATGVDRGRMVEAYPRVVNDLMFFGAPAVADIDGDGLPEAIIGTGVYDLHAVDIHGAQPVGWPKFTGGWMIGSPAVGDVDGDGLLEVVALTREGHLFVWRTAGPECGTVLWRRWHHDEWGTGNYHADTRPPGPFVPLAEGGGGGEFEDDGDGTSISRRFAALPADDLYCGGTPEYDVRFTAEGESILTPEAFEAAEWVAEVGVVGAGGRQGGRLVLSDPRFETTGPIRFAAVAIDEAGNRSAIEDIGGFAGVTPPEPTPPPAPSAGGGCQAAPGTGAAWGILGLVLFAWRRKTSRQGRQGSGAAGDLGGLGARSSSFKPRSPRSPRGGGDAGPDLRRTNG